MLLQEKRLIMKRIYKLFLIIFTCLMVSGCTEVKNTNNYLITEQIESSQADSVAIPEILTPNNGEIEVSAGSSVEDISSNQNGKLEIHFIDIGQGDCTLLECDGEYMLIDAGDNDKGTAVQLYLNKQGVKTLKYFIVTHDDSDHEGGADVIITKFNIENLFMCDFKKDSITHRDVLSAINSKSLKWSTPAVGDTYTLGSATFTIIAPNRKYSTPNNSSIAILLTNKMNKFIFTGDCENEAEADIVKNGIDIDADVLQVGHHGSHTASSQTFLDAVTPAFAVISCCTGNLYGHPRAETLNKFMAMGTQIFRTDDQGTVICYSDGTNITWNMSPSDNWTPGEPKEFSTSSKTQTENIQNTQTQMTENKISSSTTYVLNNNTHKFHYPQCKSVKKIAEKNYGESNKTREELITEGYSPCGNCKP